MNKKKKTNSKIAIIFVSLFIVMTFLAFIVYNSQLKPISKKSQEVNFVVSANDNLTTITNKLEAEEIIKSATFAKIAGKISKVSNFIEGAFTLNKSWDSNEILDYLTIAENVIPNEVIVTFQEGLWAKDIAEKLSLSIDVTKEEILDLWNDSDYIKNLMNDYPFLTGDVLNEILPVKLEGYLAPNTYNFFIDTNADTATRKILDQTLIIYNKYIDQFNSNELTVHEIFTLASITQYEAGNFEDDQIISGIWFNRLADGMKLESSVTVCYGLYEFDDWQECETNINLDSLYNTYIYPGIPPGPVTNAGEFAIKATLEPKTSDYYFFLADVNGDGTIYYSETFAEHTRKVNKYLR